MNEHIIAIHAAESTGNLAFETDPRNGIKIESLAGSALKRLAENIGRCSDSFPNDALMQIVIYVLPALKNILSSPRARIRKEYEMVSQRNLRSVCPKTINWLGKRPGKTPRQKIIASPRVLAQKKIHSYECPENNALAYLMKHLYDAVEDRINLVESKDFIEDTALYISEFRQAYWRFKHSDLADVEAKLPTRANNVLISDQDYRKVWQAIYMLKTYRLDYNENDAVEMYTQALAMQLCAQLFSAEGFMLCDKYGIWEPSDDPRTLFPLNFLVECDDGERRYITVDCAENSVTVSSVFVAYSDDNGYVQISGSISEKLRFVFDVPGKHEDGEFRISISVKKKKQVFKADYANLAEITDFLASMTGEFVKCAVKPLCENRRRNPGGIIAADFTTHRFAADDADAMSAAAYEFEDGEFMIPNEHCLYGVLEHRIDTLSMLFSQTNVEGSHIIFERAAHGGNCGCFAYLVPDNINEFDQKNIRRQVGMHLNGFPIWRSVAAAKGCQKKSLITGKSKLIYVVDADAEGCPVTRILYDNGKLEHFAFFKEDSDMRGMNSIAQEYLAAFSEKYLGEILDKDGQNAVLATGTINELIENGDENDEYGYEAVLNALDGLRIIDVFLDKELLFNVVQGFAEKLNSLLKNYPQDLIILICSSPHVKAHFSNREKIIMADENDLIVGAEELANLYVSKRIPWLEHLPELDFIVPKDGRYCPFKLVGRNNKVNAAVTEQTIRIPENMILRAGKKIHEFPLNLDSGLSGKSRINARLTDPSFPLKTDVAVKMEINYKYANEDTYELIFMPISENAPFKKITAEWVHDSNHTVANEEIDIPRNPISEEQLAIAVEKKDFLIENILKYLNILASRKRDGRFNFEMFKRNIFYLKRDLNIIIEHDYITGDVMADEIRGRISVQTICDYFNDIIFEEHHFFDADNLPEIFSAADPKGKNTFMSNVVYTFVMLSMKDGCKYFDKVIELDMFGQLAKHYKLIHRYLLTYNRSRKAWLPCMEQVRNADKVNLNSIARLLSGLFWNNPDTLMIVSKLYPDVLEKICDFINEKLNVKMVKKEQLNYNLLAMRDYMELLLVILSLRTKGFSRFGTGSREALRLADTIKLIDCKLAEAGTMTRNDKEVNAHQEFCRCCRAKLDIQLPEYLKEMSPLCYALTVYLSGESDGGSIRIESYKDTEEN